GSIDWLCWPNFASAACLAKLLGTEENGFWKLAPGEKILRSSRRYEPHTLILETTCETKHGAVRVKDFMPLRGGHSRIIRIVEGLRGNVAMRSELALRFDYGQAVPWVTRTSEGLKALAGPDSVWMHTTAPLEGKGLRTLSEFTVRKGQKISFVITYGDYGNYRGEWVGPPIDVQKAYEETRTFWMDWTGKNTYQGRHREMVERSLITLKALTYAPTGGIVAAPTTSLPEDIGGVRNWDYRYCWLRDSTLTLLALMNSGYHEEARDWMNWLRRTVAGNPDQAQIMYGVAGERLLAEWEIDALPGYENSRPVRIGNAAAGQLQLDTYGELLDTFFWTYRSLTREFRAAEFALLRAMVKHLESIWQLPDEGIWEVRGGAKHFTYSKVMAWVAFDRAIRIAEKCGFQAPIRRWKKTRDAIHRQVCEKGFSKRLNSFVQHYGAKHLDASALLLAVVGFLPPDDPRILGTVTAIEKYLMQDGLVMRYETSKTSDGLRGSEGKFLACSFWMVCCLKLIGRHAEAEKLFERLLLLANDVGLLAEEYDTKRRRQVGNFPQAFSHISLLAAAYSLSHTGQDRHTAGVLNHKA
ncbi:MAG: glycoside hydrolase family 15 protein, partial [Silvibacterium sp.]|nr:glycoside hydrolase family 15 protein [Silvibacterium sp.]